MAAVQEWNDVYDENRNLTGRVHLRGTPWAPGDYGLVVCVWVYDGQIYETIARVLGVELKAYHVASDFLAATGKYDLLGSLIGDKANSVIFDNSKLKRAVPDFVPTVRFEEGIRDTIANIMAHPELQQKDPEFDVWCDKVIDVLENAKKAF